MLISSVEGCEVEVETSSISAQSGSEESSIAFFNLFVTVY